MEKPTVFAVPKCPKGEFQKKLNNYLPRQMQLRTKKQDKRKHRKYLVREKAVRSKPYYTP